MIIMGYPQFETQCDDGTGDGLSAIPEWRLEQNSSVEDLPEFDIDVTPGVRNVFIRLSFIFQRAKRTPLPPTRFHDLTCFVIHRLLSTPATTRRRESISSDCVRCAIILYMLLLQGPTYFTHASILSTVAARLVAELQQLETMPRVYGPVDLWLVAIGLTASHDTPYYELFRDKAKFLSGSLHLSSWREASVPIKTILWYDLPYNEHSFQNSWNLALGLECDAAISDPTSRGAPLCDGPGFI